PRQYMRRIKPVASLDNLPAAPPTTGLGRNPRSFEHLPASIFRPTGDDIESIVIGSARGFTSSPAFSCQPCQTVEVASGQICIGGVEARESRDDLHRVVAAVFR